MAIHKPENLAEVVESCKRLVVKAIQLFIPDSRKSVPAQVRGFYEGIIIILHNAVGRGAGAVGLAIPSVLVSTGIVTPFTSAIWPFSESVVTQAVIDELFTGLFPGLGALVLVSRILPLGDANVSAGLLPVILHFSVICSGVARLESTALWRLLTDGLPTATVDYTVVSQLESLFSDVDHKGSDIPTTRVYENWGEIRTPSEGTH
ncbi:hypothetical protein MVEN_01596400 [Mycena venus]|uniref:Uncharacterized protein n=1 Tax=Mycena venus TaxID=2733690 RepID=A0A8H7CPV1_9AGAR|nr:hypothetical protein MVEN_01596400 [Mycena venus]